MVTARDIDPVSIIDSVFVCHVVDPYNVPCSYVLTQNRPEDHHNVQEVLSFIFEVFESKIGVGCYRSKFTRDDLRSVK